MYLRQAGRSASRGKQERGASLTGYGLVVGLIAILAIVAVTDVGDAISDLFATVDNELSGVGSGSSGGSGSSSSSGSSGSTPDPLVANDDPGETTSAGTLVSIDVLANDTGGTAPFTLSIDTQASNGTATVNGNLIDYTPVSGFGGTDSFVYQVEDNNSEIATATVTVAVGATILVTTEVDEPFGGSETVGSPDGTGLSLREAIGIAVNDDVIGFDTGSMSGTTIVLSSQLEINSKDIGIAGGGAITIDGNNSSRTFLIHNGSMGYLSGLTLVDASSTSTGGSILVDGGGTMTLNDSTVTGSAATNSGGAIYVGSGADVTILASTISDNTTTIDGGAIYNEGTLTITNSTVSGNSAPGGGGSPDGGAIYNTSTLTISGSTFTNNSVNGWGGFMRNQGGSYIIVNSTIAGNYATGSGGGGILSVGGNSSIDNCTFTGNSAVGTGGAIDNRGILEVNNSIFVGNDADTDNNQSPDGDTIYQNSAGTITGAGNVMDVALDNNGGTATGFSAVTTSATPAGTFASVGSYAGSGISSAGLLASNGGPTETVNILTSGSAHNTGNDAAASGITTDQRGFTRPVGQVDSGAVELQ